MSKDWPFLKASQRKNKRLRDWIATTLDNQRPHLFLWMPICLGTGIGAYFALPVEPSLHPAIWVTVLIGLAGAGLALSRPALRWLILAMALVVAGLALATLRSHLVDAPVLTREMTATVEGRVIGQDRSSSNRVRLLLDDVIIYGTEPDQTPKRIRISFSEDTLPPAAGERILVQARISPPGGPVEPGGFDFRRLAWFQRLGAVGYALGPIVPSLTPQKGNASVQIQRARLALSSAIQARIVGPEGAFAAAILTGDRSAIDPDMLIALRASNLAHLLAISGLHMGLLTGFVFAATRYGVALIPGLALRWPAKKIGAAVAICAGLSYLVLSGASIATQRAFVMALVVLMAIIVDRPALTLRAVALAALIILVIRPESLTQAGFQMSFSATIGLVAGFDLLRRTPWWKRPVSGWRKFGRGVFTLAFSSAVAGAATAPISAFHFNQIAQYGLLANITAVPLMGFLVMPAAVISIFLIPFGLEGLALQVTGFGISAILAIADWVAGLPGSVVPITSAGWTILPLFAAGALWLVVWRGPVRLLGVPITLAAFALWSIWPRPDILIDGTSRLVGVLTPDGRVLHKSRGGGFAASTWLENDGDQVDQKAANARPGLIPGTSFIEGQSGAYSIMVATGKSGPLPECSDQSVLIALKQNIPSGDCTTIDARFLSENGSVAIHFSPDGPRIQTARAAAGQRPWTDPAR